MPNRIEELRRSRDLSQTALGKILGVDQSTISNWENEKREFDHQELHRLADFFGVSVDYLLCRDEKAPDTAEAVSGAMTDKEKEFLTYARQMSEEQKGFLVAVMRALIEQGPAQSPDPPAKADETD